MPRQRAAHLAASPYPACSLAQMVSPALGMGILILSGANTFTGPLTINSGETRLNNLAAAGGSADDPWGSESLWR